MDMTASSPGPQAPRAPMPKWFWPVGWTGLAWNAYGVQQFAGDVTATSDSMVAMGMTPDQAALYSDVPMWMTLAFATGVFGGLAGCALLLLRRKLATQVFLISLVGYLVLYVGDITEGIFAALGTGQVVILTAVVLIASALLWLSRHLETTRRLA